MGTPHQHPLIYLSFLIIFGNPLVNPHPSPLGGQALRRRIGRSVGTCHLGNVN